MCPLTSYRPGGYKYSISLSHHLNDLSIHFRYWHQFQIRDIPAWGMGQPAQGQPVEHRQYGYSQVSFNPKQSFLMAVHVLMTNQLIVSLLLFSQGRTCPGCCRRYNECCCCGPMYMPYDMAYIPVMVPMSVDAW